MNALAQSPGGVLYLPVIQRSSRPILTGPGEWPTVAANPQRTSFTTTEVKGKLRAEWYTKFNAYISQNTQIIATGNKLFISAADGLHALDSNNGEQVWFFPTSLPLGNSPTVANNVVYVGGHDRKLYAINASTGKQIWAFTAGAGFDSNPLVVGNMVYAGNRDGVFYAVNAQNGQLAWSYPTGGPIHYSAAFSDNAVYFASNDMHAYALNASNGGLIWKSSKLPGTGFHSWWPVIYDNYVVFSGSYYYRYVGPFSGRVGHQFLEKEAYPPNTPDGGTVGPLGKEPGDWAPGTNTINASSISQYFEAKPHRRTVFYLHRANGQELTYDSDRDGRAEYAPFLFFGTHSGTRYPPMVGPDNVIYQTNNFLYADNDGIPRGHLAGWKLGTPIISIPSGNANAVDEPMGYSVGGNTVYWKRCCDRKAGAFNLTTGDDTTYFDEGGSRLRRTMPELFGEPWAYAYWKHGDTTPPIPYNGRVYILAENAVVAFSPHGREPVLPLDESRGTNTGTDPEDFERGSNYTGLNTKVTLNNTNWPLLYQQETYNERAEAHDTRAMHFRLFEVAGTTSGGPSSLQASTNSIGAQLVSTFGGSQTLRTWVSSRTPTVLFQNTSNTYQLRGRISGFAYPTSGGVQVRTGTATVDNPAMSGGWLLVWDAGTDHRWVPMVVSLQNRPTQIRLDGSGLTMTFSGGAGYMGATPLYGMSAPRSNERTAWSSGIPSSTVNRVRDIIDRVGRAFPTSVNESRSINSSNGDVDLTYTYQFITFAGPGNASPLRIAYLPSHLALAAWNGSPIRVNGGEYGSQAFDIQFLTPLGRVGGRSDADSVTVRLPGLANYWRQNVSIPTPTSSGALQNRLAAEVQKILAAGHLMPGFGQNGLFDNFAVQRTGHYAGDYWHNPTDTVYTLIRALPFLPSNLQTQVRTYLTNEFAQYPTHSVAHVGWATGNQRDSIILPPEVLAERGGYPKCGPCNSWGFPQENHYGSWLYAANIGGSASSIYSSSLNDPDKFSNSPVFKQSMPLTLNGQLAGHIGILRLAQMANTGDRAALERTLTDLFILRAAMSKYPSALSQTGFEYAGYRWSVRTYAPNMPDTLFNLRTMGTIWSQAPLYGKSTDLIYGYSRVGDNFAIDYLNLVPEVGRFMRDYVLKEEQAAVADYEWRAPYWFVSNAEEGASESAIRPIYDTIALFNAKAMILGASRADLERYVDVPAVPVGDLYYIQKLILTLSARN